VVAVPGSTTNYSGGGIVIEQVLLTDVTKSPFPKLMNDLVLSPLGMSSATFEHPLPPQIREHIAQGHNDDGSVIPGGWRIGPEAAAGWMWTTATDLMRWAIGIDESRKGKPGGILSAKMATQMLTVQKDQYGLGPVLEGRGKAFRFSHGGNNPGYTAQLTYFPETGQGAAILVNTGTADVLIEEVTRAIAKEYNWPALQPSTIKPLTLGEKTISQITGKYALLLPGSTEPMSAEIRSENARIIFHAPPVIVDDDLLAISETEFVSPGWGYRIRFEGIPGGAATGFSLRYGQNDMTAKRDGK
jgi:CubicO group peptidase (beta-lactamase class C family)